MFVYIPKCKPHSSFTFSCFYMSPCVSPAPFYLCICLLTRARLLCDNQRHSGFPLRWLTFEGVYIWYLFLNAFAIQLRLVSNQKLTRIQRRAYRLLQSKVLRFWEKYENGEKTAAQLLKSISTLNGPSRAE